MSEAGTGVDYVVWPFEPAAWNRIQAAVGHRAEGDPRVVWKWIDQGLLFTCMEQQRKPMPPLKEIRSNKQRLLDNIDGLIGHLELNPSLSTTGPFQAGAQAINWLMQGAMRKLHPTGPQLAENGRRDRVSMSQSVITLRENYDEVQLPAQTQVMALLRQLSPLLGSLREFVAVSLVETSIAQSRGPGLDLTRLTFVEHTAIAYELAYKRPARPGRKGGADEAGPTVRFIASVAEQARRTDTIEPHYRALLRPGLHVTANTIHRLLSKRQAR